MPAKSRPTTALVFDQQLSQQQQQDAESLSSDEFVLSASSLTRDNQPKGIIASIQSSTRAYNSLGFSSQDNGRSRRDQDLNSEYSDDADGRLTDTENELGRDRVGTGTPVLAGLSQFHVAAMDNASTTALQSLRGIEEHDKDDRQSHGIEARFRTMAQASDQDQNSEGGDSSDPQPEVALDADQIQGKANIGMGFIHGDGDALAYKEQASDSHVSSM